MVIASTFADVIIPDVSIYDFLFAELDAEDAGRPAITDPAAGRTMTYGELRVAVDAFAGALAARGFGSGDRIGLHAPNGLGFAIAFHGVLRAGATVTTVNALFTADEIAKQLVDAHASALITVSPLLPHALPAAQRAGIRESNVVVLDGADGHDSLQSLLGEGEAPPETLFDPQEHLAVLPYSSGTTGVPKGVELSHRNLVANVAQANPLVQVQRSDVVQAVLPFFHIYGMTVLLNIALKERAHLVTMPRFDFVQYLSLIAEHRISYSFIAPPIAVALAKHPLVDQYDLRSLHTVLSGAAPLDGGLADAVARRLEVKVYQGFGMTELSPVSHVIPLGNDEISRDSIGLLLPNMTCRVVDPETGADVEIPDEGESAPGEMWCAGPNVMRGYLGNPEATAAVLDEDGYLHTGDVVTVTADGVFRVVDRLKELIKYKGYQVAPAELEALLLSHPEIADAAVVGVPEEQAGEIPKAFVVRQEGSSIDEADVMSFVAERVAPHKKIRAVAFIDQVPKSASGKILRKDLR